MTPPEPLRRVTGTRHAAPTIAVPGGTHPGDVASLLADLMSRLAGSGPALRLVDPNATPDATRPEPTVPPEVAVVVATSGSTTGTGNLVALDAAALTASARATHSRLGGPGQWLACLPVHHVAGLQVLTRSVVAGTRPAVLDSSAGFRPDALVAAARTMRSDVPTYVSLVPTHLTRLMTDGPQALAALRGFHAVLVGGASTARGLLDRARDAGVRVVTTYGMTETSGGCVYDGTPLPGVQVDVDDEARVWLAGPTLARGYLDPAADQAAFVTRDGQRWLRTADRGVLHDASLTVLGRLDDVILSGGVSVSTAAVERAVLEVDGVRDAVVVAVPDDHWGSLVTAVIAGRPPALDGLRELVGARLGREHAPRALVRMDSLPVRGPGKVDRQEAAGLARRLLSTAAPGTERLP